MNFVRRALSSSVIAFVALTVLIVPSAYAVSPNIVISQVYGGAGCGTAGCSTYKNDYIELFNRGTVSVSVNGWSVQYASAAGTAWSVTNLPNVSIPAGGYLLVGEGAGANGVNNIPTPDVSGTIAMSATAAKVALVNTTAALSGACPASASIVDLVGYGGTASCSETAVAPAPSTTTADVRALAGCTDTDNNSTDFTATTPNPRNSATALAPCGGGPSLPNLSINDVSLAEGDAGTTTFTFTVSLSAAAGAGGVTFDIATADGTATSASNDYVAKSLTGQSIPAGNSSYTFSVTVNGDTTTETNETFFVNVTNVTGATVTDGQGLGTINNDDVTLTPIHNIQGNGATSPLVGTSVSTRGIVTGIRSNGFFIQEPDATVDADPATSEGILVFTNAAPPAAAIVGNYVQVTGTVSEFVPSADPQQPPATELVSPTVLLISSGNPLPTPTPLTATFPDPAGPYDQLERLEGMRVSVASLTVVAPTGGTVNEPNATSTSNGVFFGVVTGVARPFREPGIQAPDAPPPGSNIPPIPRWDANPEAIRVDSDGQTGGTAINVSTNAVLTNVVGPLDYTFRHYTILPDPATPPSVTPGMTTVNASAPTSTEFTVASFNLERFFDTTNDPSIGEPVLTATAFNNRLNKASLAIRNALGTPDIVGVEEVENLSTLQTLATKISNDAIAAAQPDPMYQAYLVEGNDVGGIDVGFLVKTSTVSGSTPRVEVLSVVQELANTQFVNPDNTTSNLNDRPPLRLNAIVHHANGGTFPVTVIVNHLRSLNGVDDDVTPGSNGWSTDGARIRAKRQKQAEDLANLVQSRQIANPNERIILVGDFNAFEFNDGYGDSINTIAGTPTPDNETAVTGDGADLVNPNLDPLDDTPPPAERYSYSFDGSAQSLDHVIVNQAVLSAATARVEHPRINGDFPETDRNDSTSPRRLSDHDPIVAFIGAAAFASTDLAVTKVESVDPVNAGTTLTYTITVSNLGPATADNVTLADTLSAGTTFNSLSQSGWSCTTPTVGVTGTINCSIASLAASGSSVLTLVVNVDSTIADGTTLSNTATVGMSTIDSNTNNNSATETTTVAAVADMAITSATDSPDPVNAGTNVTYNVATANNGPATSTNNTFTFTLDANTTFVSVTAPAGWSCTTPAVGVTGTITCTIASLAPAATSNFTVVANVPAAVAGGTTLTAGAQITSDLSDSNEGNGTASITTDVVSTADVSTTLSDSPDPVAPGGSLMYTATVSNGGPSNAANVTFTLPLDANTLFVSLSAPAGWSCTTPTVGTTGTISCTIASLAPGVANFTVNTIVPASVTSGTTLTATANVATSSGDSNESNNSATATTAVNASANSANLSLTKSAPANVTAGTNLVYTINFQNAGPDAALNAIITDTLPAGTTFQSAVISGGWTCSTPAVGATGTVSCSNATFANAATGSLTLTVAVPPTAAGGTSISNTAVIAASSTDPAPGNESSTATTTVVSTADISVTITDSPDPVVPTGTLTYTIGVTNAGPSNANNASLSIPLSAQTTFTSLASPAGWSCTTPAVGTSGTITCTNASFAAGTGNFTLTTAVTSNASGTISTTANVATSSNDSNTANNSATATTTVTALGAFSATKSVSGNFVPAGLVTYTVTITNGTVLNQANNAGDEFVDILPAQLTLISASATSGTAFADVATNTVHWNGALAANNGSVTITINAQIKAATATGTSVSNQGTVSYDSDNNGTNDATLQTDDTSVAGAANATAFTVASAGTFTATKSVTGTFAPNGQVTYTVTISNGTVFAQADNTGDEFVDTLPADLTLVSANATSGTATTAGNTVHWNGALAANGGSVTLTILATVNPTVVGGAVVSNQGTVSYDSDNNGSNDATLVTDDPSTAAAGDPTLFTIVSAIPTLSEWALILLGLSIALLAVSKLK